MKVYVGSTGTKRHVEALKLQGHGRLVTCAGWKNPIPGLSWALDNGAFSDWLAHKPFDGNRFVKCLDKIPDHSVPDFIVLPDIVAGGRRSLTLSLAWHRILPSKWRYYLAVQDGMTPDDVIAYVDELDGQVLAGIFVGGTMEWKTKHGPRFVPVAHEQFGIPIHFGRVGTFKRLVWAREIGADSLDSSTFDQKPRHGKPDKMHYIPSAEAQTRLPMAIAQPL